MTFFIADTHFGHDRIIDFENRPFKNSKEMNGILISNWNKVVSADDTVFMLGDFGMGTEEQIQNWVSSLNGYKILVLGNHDREIGFTYSFWLSAGFDEVYSYPIIYNEWYILSHEPVYLNKNMPYANIFGHVHGNPSYADFTKQSFCISAERINYTPIEWGVMLNNMKISE